MNEDKTIKENERIKWQIGICDGAYTINKDEIKKNISKLYKLAKKKMPKIIYSNGPDNAQKNAASCIGCGDDHYFPMSEVVDLNLFDLYISSTKTKLLEIERNLIKNGVFSMITLDEVCIICPHPAHFAINDRGDLHDSTGPAIIWPDSHKQHYINGIYLDKKMFDQYILNKRSAKEILNISNVEQRAAIMLHYGWDYLKSDLDDFKVIDSVETKSPYNGIPLTYELFSFTIGSNRVHVLMLMDCTDAEKYYHIVPNTTKSVQEARAWMFSIDPKEFYPDMES